MPESLLDQICVFDRKSSIREVSRILWSPRGDWGAFTVAETSDDAAATLVQGPEIENLYVVRRDLKSVKLLYAGRSPFTHPEGDKFCGDHTLPQVKCWSPDGKRLLFNKYYPMGTRGDRGAVLFDVNPVTGKISQISRPYRWSHLEGDFVDDVIPFGDSVACSPDGRRVAVVHGDGRYGKKELRIAVVDFQTHARTWITGFDTGASSPNWSPDGKWIAFAALPSVWTDEMKRLIHYDSRLAAGFLAVWIMRPDGSDKRQLTLGPSSGDYPRWIDSSTIEFVREGALWTVSTVSGDIKRRGELTPDELQARYFRYQH